MNGWLIAGVVLGTLGAGLLIRSFHEAAKEGDSRIAESERWAKLSPEERLEELKTKARGYSRD